MGQVLGPAGINIGEFVKKFNDASKEMRGDMVPAEISVYEDRTYTFVLKTPPVSSLILKALVRRRGAANPTQLRLARSPRLRSKRLPSAKCPT